MTERLSAYGVTARDIFKIQNHSVAQKCGGFGYFGKETEKDANISTSNDSLLKDTRIK